MNGSNRLIIVFILLLIAFINLVADVFPCKAQMYMTVFLSEDCIQELLKEKHE